MGSTPHAGMAAAAVRRPQGVEVRFRRMKFDFEERGFARYWHGESPFITMFWTQLSAAFEPGERFFIDSARALRDCIKDPELLEELSEFCKQEGHHTAQHAKLDRMTAEQGVDVDGCRRRYQRVLDFYRRTLEPMDMLAVTCALEHFTAGFARQYLENPAISEGADPNVKALWMWHAAEELEHKATCYDVYRQAGGSELRRIAVEPSAWLIITTLALINTVVLLRQQGKLGDVRDIAKGARYLFGRRGLITSMLPAFVRYLSPRFHPWKSDDSESIARWRKTFARYIASEHRASS